MTGPVSMSTATSMSRSSRSSPWACAAESIPASIGASRQYHLLGISPPELARCMDLGSHTGEYLPGFDIGEEGFHPVQQLDRGHL